MHVPCLLLVLVCSPYSSRGCAHAQDRGIALGSHVTPQVVSNIDKSISKFILFGYEKDWSETFPSTRQDAYVLLLFMDVLVLVLFVIDYVYS